MRGRRHFAIVAVGLVLALTGCGDDGGGKAADSDHDKALKYAQCMRDNGVDMEDPKEGEGLKVELKGGDKETMEKAQQACKKWAPGGADGKIDPKQRERMLDFAKCMRDEGVEDFPDPAADGGIRMNRDLEKDPQYEAAQAKCSEKYLPEAGR